jgi:hypothetical protein
MESRFINTNKQRTILGEGLCKKGRKEGEGSESDQSTLMYMCLIMMKTTVFLQYKSNMQCNIKKNYQIIKLNCYQYSKLASSSVSMLSRIKRDFISLDDIEVFKIQKNVEPFLLRLHKNRSWVKIWLTSDFMQSYSL